MTMRVALDVQACQWSQPEADGSTLLARVRGLLAAWPETEAPCLIANAWLEVPPALLAVQLGHPVHAFGDGSQEFSVAPTPSWQLALRAARLAELRVEVVLVLGQHGDGASGLILRDPLARIPEFHCDASPESVRQALATIRVTPKPEPPQMPHRTGHVGEQHDQSRNGKLRLAYVSPLPPIASGIADYSAELLPALTREYDVSLVVAQADVVNPINGCAVLDVETFRAQASTFDRVLYHLGNSPYHAHMLPLLRAIPGAVVLHDVFIGHLLAYINEHGDDPQALRRAVWQSHGYAGLALWRERGSAAVLTELPCCGEVLALAQAVIVHSSHALEILSTHFSAPLLAQCRVLPLPQARSPLPSRDEARARLGLDSDCVLVCSFGYVGPGKLSRELVAAWQLADLHQQGSVRLALVGGHQFDDRAAAELTERIATLTNVTLTGYVSADTYRDYLAACDVAVQLRANSRGETSRAVLEVMSQGIPLVINDHGANAELVPDAGMLLADPVSEAQLAHALRQRMTDRARWREQALAAQQRVQARHAPEVVARRYAEIMNAAASRPASGAARQQAALHELAQRDITLAWHEAWRFADGLRARVPQAGLARYVAAPITLALPPRRVEPDLDGLPATWRVVLLTDEDLDEPRSGAAWRSRAMRQQYLNAGHQVLTWSASDLDEASLLASALHIWHCDQPALMPRLSRLRRGLSQPPLLIFAPAATHWATADPAVESSVSDRQAGPDLVILASAQQARSLVAGGFAESRVCVLPDGADLPQVEAWRTDGIYRDHFPQQAFAAMMARDDELHRADFLRMMGASLAFLPPGRGLVLAGGLAESLVDLPAYRRWFGINDSRIQSLGRCDVQTWATARRHAQVILVPRWQSACHGDLSQRLLEAVSDGAYVVAGSGALLGCPELARADQVYIEDDPEQFRRRWLTLLRRPAVRRRPRAWQPWHVALAPLLAAVRARLRYALEENRR